MADPDARDKRPTARRLPNSSNNKPIADGCQFNSQPTAGHICFPKYNKIISLKLLINIL
jgi:hypothetical protein